MNIRIRPPVKTIKTPAKINFGLRIGEKRDTGYHPISTIFLPVSLFDTIHLELTETGGIRLECDHPAVPCDRTNLCWRAAELFIQETGISSGVHISLEKVIPVGAGLGGGSSNAAAILEGLSDMHPETITGEKLLPLAIQLGADVPFFLLKQPCSAGGIGEILQPVTFPWKCSILLVIPSYTIGTAGAYAAFDQFDMKVSSPVDCAKTLATLQTLKHAREVIGNDFEAVLFPQYPELESIKQKLYGADADYASLTGSGSTVYGMFENASAAYDATNMFKSAYRTEIVTPLI